MSWQISALIVLGVWLLILTIAFIVLLRFFRRLVHGAKDLDLRSILDKIMTQGEANREGLGELTRELKRLDEEGALHVQKVGLVRFNPFKEIGGDQSFSVALLDEEHNGVIITSYYGRELNRVYAKQIQAGKSEHELSEEEKEAISQAIGVTKSK